MSYEYVCKPTAFKRGQNACTWLKEIIKSQSLFREYVISVIDKAELYKV